MSLGGIVLTIFFAWREMRPVSEYELNDKCKPAVLLEINCCFLDECIWFNMHPLEKD